MNVEEIKTAGVSALETRKADINKMLLEDDGIDLDAVETEINAIEERMASIKAQEKRRKDMLKNLASNPASGEPMDDIDTSISSLEYRTAYKNYVQRGVMSPILKPAHERANAMGIAADLGVLTPETVIQKVMTEFEGVYGQLYGKVRKTNFKGGVKYPVGSFKATCFRITETTVSDRQKAGGVTEYVEFSYELGEIRVARTLLQEILSVEAFESELAKVIVRAYIEKMDKEIMTGDPSKHEMEGILTEYKKTNGSRIKAENVIKMSEADFLDWTKWETKFFGEIPLAMEGARTEFCFAKQTYALLGTMKDSNGQPIKKASYDHDHKQRTFDAYPVTLVEKDILPSFELANAGDVVGLFWVPEEAYCVNTNLDFTMMHYFDQETNQYVDKALFVNDGKILDPKYLYLIVKDAAGKA